MTGNTEMTLSPTKFGQSIRWIESYAGYTDESKLLYSLYKLGKEQGVQIHPDYEMYSNEQARTFCLWNTTPRLPWQTPAYYASEAAILPDNEFRRIHRNEWVTSEDTFVPTEWWAACYETFPEHELPKHHPMILALDAAVTQDTFGIAGVSRVPGKERREETFVRFAQKWSPPKGGKINFQGTKDDPGPEMVIERLCKEYNIVEIAYDPMQLEDMAGRLSRKGIAWFRPFNQGADRLVADSSLRSRIRDRRIHHQGNLDLTEHMKNAVAKVDTGSGRNIRIIKKNAEAKIDLAVCVSMADSEAMRLNL